jgi:tetratricopeptide (TPR) repeat protein
MTESIGSQDSPPEDRLELYLQIAVRQILKHEDFAEFASWSEQYMWSFLRLPIEPGVLSDPDEQRRFAIVITRQVWNATPLPGNGYRPKPLPEPDRNAPCFCGSGRKYKQCCRLTIDSIGLVPITREVLWPAVLATLSHAAVSELACSPHAPVGPLAGYALDLAKQGKTREAAKLLRSMFDAPIRDYGEDAGHAYDTLCNLYDELGQTKQKIELTRGLLATLPRSPLRSSVHQRMAAMFMDAQEPEEAWNAFRLAQQDAPGDPGLPILEVNLLLANGQSAQAKDRAAFWLRALSKRDDDIGLELDFLRKVAADPEAAMVDAGHGMDGGAGSWLREWVAQIERRPLPRYTVREDPMETSFKDDPDNEGAAASQVTTIAVHTLVTPQSLRKVERQWRKAFPLDQPFSTQDMPGGGAYAWDDEVEERWRMCLSKHPDAADSLSVLDDIVTALRQLQQSQYSWFDRLVVRPILQRSMAITEEAIKAIEHPRLEWPITDNRPALRAFARGYGVYMNLDDEDRALSTARRLLELNPRDNHGFRTLVINADLRAGADRQALELADGYPGDMNPETAYGRALALYRLGQLETATTALRSAITDLPRVPKHLLADSIRQPKMTPGYLALGGDDQAWIYREDMRSVWLQTPGAITWLETVNRQVRPKAARKRQ